MTTWTEFLTANPINIVTSRHRCVGGNYRAAHFRTLFFRKNLISGRLFWCSAGWICTSKGYRFYQDGIPLLRHGGMSEAWRNIFSKMDRTAKINRASISISWLNSPKFFMGLLEIQDLSLQVLKQRIVRKWRIIELKVHTFYIFV